MVADHLSRLQHRDTHELPINAYLRDDTLLKVMDLYPWYAKIVNYIVVGYVARGGQEETQASKSFPLVG